MNLSRCNGLDLESIQLIANNCVELEELDLRKTELCQDSIDFLAKNLTPKVVKLYLGSNENVNDENLKALVMRCRNLTELDLSGTSISNVASIVEYLNLEKINISSCQELKLANLKGLKTMPRFKMLLCDTMENNIFKLKVEAPYLEISDSKTFLEASGEQIKSKDGFWDISVQRIQMFSALF